MLSDAVEGAFAPMIFRPVRIVAIGHRPHGKSSLGRALERVLAEERGEPVPEEWEDKATVGIFEYRIGTRSYLHFDCSGGGHDTGAMAASAAYADGAILVVAADEGLQQQTRGHLRLLQQMGVPALIVFINKIDLANDVARQHRLARDLAELVPEYGFPANDVPMISGSALATLEGRNDEIGRNAVRQLIKVIESRIGRVERPKEPPFLLQVHDAFRLDGCAIALGMVERGVVEVGDGVELVGLGAPQRTIVTRLQQRNAHFDRVEAGDFVGCMLQDIKREDVQRGQFLCTPGSVMPRSRFTAALQVLKQAEGGRPVLLSDAPARFMFALRDIPVAGVVRPVEEMAMLAPGANVLADVELVHSTPLMPGMRFAFIEAQRDRVIGVGHVDGLPGGG